MKQKYILQLNKLIVLGVFFITSFFAFGSPAAYASCNYNINFGSDKTSATAADKLVLTAVVTRSGSVSDCTSGITFRLSLSTKYDTFPRPGQTVDTKTVSFNGNTSTAVFNFDLKNFDRSVLPSTNRLDFKVTALNNSGLLQLTQSGVVSVFISGTGGSQGTANVTVQLDHLSGVTEGDKLVVDVYSNNIREVAGSSVPKINLALYVNGGSSPIASFDQNTSAFVDHQKFNNLLVSSGNGFKNGQNTITVKLFQSGQNLEFGEGFATIQAQGLPENPGANPGSTNPGANPGTTNPGANPGSTNPGANPGTTPATGSSVDCQKTPNDPSCVYNPLGFSDIPSFMLYIIKWLLGIIGTFAVLMIILGGFRMVFAQGNEEAFGKARKTIVYAVIGLVVAVLSFTIIQIVSNILKAGVHQ